MNDPRISRRQVLCVGSVGAVGIYAAACGGDGETQGDPGQSMRGGSEGGLGDDALDEPGAVPGDNASDGEPLDDLTATCGDVTPPNSEGPFFSPDSPERSDLVEPGVSGAPLRVTGRVLSKDCLPIAGAWLDFWQTDGEGVYDNEGFTLRGHQYAAEDGRFALQTVMPGRYGVGGNNFRTPHIHVKVGAPGYPVLTTQLYFEGQALNATDGLFDARLLTTPLEVGTREGAAITFTFVLEALDLKG